MITLDLPFATPSQNELKHWHFGKLKKWRDTVCMIIRQRLLSAGVAPTWQPILAGTGRRKAEPLFGVVPRRMRVRFVRYSAGRLDKGNLIGGMKPLLDALVLEGVLFDDSTQWLDDAYEQQSAGRGEGRTVVEVSDAVEMTAA